MGADVAKVAARRALRSPIVSEDILSTALQPHPHAWCDVSRRKRVESGCERRRSGRVAGDRARAVVLLEQGWDVTLEECA
ncbi:MAG: hypothetical protein WBV82_22420 [Myxococcaceae bacterium]